jgi:NitT/TauT family transport system substrate-binding protein
MPLFFGTNAIGGHEMNDERDTAKGAVISRRLAVGGIATLPVALALPARAQSKPIRVGATYADTTAEGWYASKLGLFEKASLNVEMTKFANSGTTMTAVLGRALDIGVSDTFSLATAISRRAPFVIIAGAGMYRTQAPTTALCVPLDSPIKTAKDLVGKTVGVLGLRGATDIGTHAWLDRNGVKPEEVRYTEIPLPQAAPAIRRGTIDAGILAEPFLSQNKDKTVRVLGNIFDAVAPEFFIANWFTSRAFYQQNQKLVERFVDVVYQTANWANAHHEQSAPILSDISKVPLATIEGMIRVAYGTSTNPALIDPVLTALYKCKFIDHTMSAADVVARPV